MGANLKNLPPNSDLNAKKILVRELESYLNDFRAQGLEATKRPADRLRSSAFQKVKELFSGSEESGPPIKIPREYDGMTPTTWFGSNIFICSPFIKYTALESLLNLLEEDDSITIVTRWEVDEIVAGVSDVAIWELISGRPNAKIYLLSNLHAKYYRIHGECLHGSANLTSKGFGLLGDSSNVELLLECPEDFKFLQFEEDLIDESLVVTEAVYELFSSLSKEFIPEKETLDQEVFDWMDITWPRISCPANLFKYYSTGNAEEIEEIQSV